MVLYKEPPSPEIIGFYMPDSPYAKVDGDFHPDKARKKAQRSQGQMENDVVDEHHVGRKWAEQLALMTRQTGAYVRGLSGSTTPSRIARTHMRSLTRTTAHAVQLTSDLRHTDCAVSTPCSWSFTGRLLPTVASTVRAFTEDTPSFYTWYRTSEHYRSTHFPRQPHI